MPTPMNAVLRALGSFHTGRHNQPASGKSGAQSQDKARTVVVLGIEAVACIIKNIGQVAVLACSPCHLANAALVCSWLALRAGVLRRAVSSWVRPLLQHRTSSVSVGRMPLRPTLPAYPPRSCAFASPVCSSQVGRFSALAPVRPNRSLNRTHCGVPPFGLENPSPNAATPQRSG